MERFDDPDLSEDENDPNPGHLNQEATEALFGGGDDSGSLFKVSYMTETIKTFSKQAKRDHKEIMLDVIAKSKKHKFERQQEKEQMLNDFEKFDEQFKQIRQLTANLERTAGTI